MRLVIPTLERYSTLKKRTLAYLEECNFPKDLIDIFVADEQELEKYKEVCGDYNYIIGQRGKANISNFIMNHYADGTQIFCLDDDIEYIYNIDYIDKKVITKKVIQFHQLVLDSFEIMNKCGAKMFGFHVASNDNWLATDPRKIKRRICLTGASFGMVVDKECKIDTYIDDLERSLFYWNKYNNTNICFIKYSFKTPAQWNEGGLFKERTKDNYLDELNKLTDKYPDYILGVKEKKKGQVPFGIRLKQVRQKENLDIYYNENCYSKS